MNPSYSEIVIEGPFMLLKGFLLGFLSVHKPDGKYFFHRKAGIRRETFKDYLKELFELDNFVHLCLETDLIQPFIDASQLYTQITDMTVHSIKPINSASFSFAYEFYNEDLAQNAKSMIEKPPKGVNLVDYYPVELRENEPGGVEAYAPLHDYTARAKGTLMGDFEGVIDLYISIKRSEVSESIICSDVRLALD